jgi:uncharacterized repeat protein (TIGR02543 family)
VWHLHQANLTSGPWPCSDSAGNGNTVTPGSSFPITPSKIGKVGFDLYTDGNNGYLSADNSTSLSLSATFTISAWVKYNSSINGGPEYSWVICKDAALSNYCLGFHKTGAFPSQNIYPYLVGPSGVTYVQSTNAFPKDVWTLITGVYDGSGLTIYVNGVFDSSVVVSGGLTTNSNSLFIGGHDPADRTFIGLIDEIRIYSDAKLVNRLLTDYNNQNDPATFSACGGELVYTLTYDGNGNTGGTAPVDPLSPYEAGAIANLAENTGNLVRTGYAFIGWNTAPDGSGDSYNVDDAIYMWSAVVLYAHWTLPWITVTDVLIEGSSPVTGFYVDLLGVTPGEGTTDSPYTRGQFVSAFYYASENITFYIRSISVVSTDLVISCITSGVSINLEPWDLTTYGPWGFIATDGATVTIELPQP